MRNLGIDYDRRIDIVCDRDPDGTIEFGTMSNLNFHDNIGFLIGLHKPRKPEMWFSLYLCRICVSLVFVTISIDLQRIHQRNGNLSVF